MKQFIANNIFWIYFPKIVETILFSAKITTDCVFGNNITFCNHEFMSSNISEAVAQTCSVRKVLLEISQNSQKKNLC